MGKMKLTVATACALLALTVGARADRTPDVPANIAVPDGNKVEFHAYAIGVQIYTWNGTTWGASVPDAILLDSDGNVVGRHYAGPTWQTDSGSLVRGQKQAAVVVDSTAIPWLRLIAVLTEGNGVLAQTTYIQRVNTAGGLAPAITGGEVVGQVARVPYTAEYYFYRATNDE